MAMALVASQPEDCGCIVWMAYFVALLLHSPAGREQQLHSQNVALALLPYVTRQA